MKIKKAVLTQRVRNFLKELQEVNHNYESKGTLNKKQTDDALRLFPGITFISSLNGSNSAWISWVLNLYFRCLQAYPEEDIDLEILYSFMDYGLQEAGVPTSLTTLTSETKKDQKEVKFQKMEQSSNPKTRDTPDDKFDKQVIFLSRINLVSTKLKLSDKFLLEYPSNHSFWTLLPFNQLRLALERSGEPLVQILENMVSLKSREGCLAYLLLFPHIPIQELHKYSAVIKHCMTWDEMDKKTFVERVNAIFTSPLPIIENVDQVVNKISININEHRYQKFIDACKYLFLKTHRAKNFNLWAYHLLHQLLLHCSSAEAIQKLQDFEMIIDNFAAKKETDHLSQYEENIVIKNLADTIIYWKDKPSDELMTFEDPIDLKIFSYLVSMKKAYAALATELFNYINPTQKTYLLLFIDLKIDFDVKSILQIPMQICVVVIRLYRECQIDPKLATEYVTKLNPDINLLMYSGAAYSLIKKFGAAPKAVLEKLSKCTNEQLQKIMADLQAKGLRHEVKESKRNTHTLENKDQKDQKSENKDPKDLSLETKKDVFDLGVTLFELLLRSPQDKITPQARFELYQKLKQAQSLQSEIRGLKTEPKSETKHTQGDSKDSKTETKTEIKREIKRHVAKDNQQPKLFTKSGVLSFVREYEEKLSYLNWWLNYSPSITTIKKLLEECKDESLHAQTFREILRLLLEARKKSKPQDTNTHNCIAKLIAQVENLFSGFDIDNIYLVLDLYLRTIAAVSPKLEEIVPFILDVFYYVDYDPDRISHFINGIIGSSLPTGHPAYKFICELFSTYLKTNKNLTLSNAPHTVACLMELVKLKVLIPENAGKILVMIYKIDDHQILSRHISSFGPLINQTSLEVLSNCRQLVKYVNAAENPGRLYKLTLEAYLFLTQLFSQIQNLTEDLDEDFSLGYFYNCIEKMDPEFRYKFIVAAQEDPTLLRSLCIVDPVIIPSINPKQEMDYYKRFCLAKISENIAWMNFFAEVTFSSYNHVAWRTRVLTIPEDWQPETAIKVITIIKRFSNEYYDEQLWNSGKYVDELAAAYLFLQRNNYEGRYREFVASQPKYSFGLASALVELRGAQYLREETPLRGISQDVFDKTDEENKAWLLAHKEHAGELAELFNFLSRKNLLSFEIPELIKELVDIIPDVLKIAYANEAQIKSLEDLRDCVRGSYRHRLDCLSGLFPAGIISPIVDGLVPHVIFAPLHKPPEIPRVPDPYSEEGQKLEKAKREKEAQAAWLKQYPQKEQKNSL